jgi:hypothetical protein
MNIDLDSTEEYETTDRYGRRMLVQLLHLDSQLPTSDHFYGHGPVLKKDGSVGVRRGTVRLPLEDVPEHLLDVLRERGVIQPKRRRNSEAARQAALS